MHTVELLEQAVQLLERLGYVVRHEWLGGNGGGACEIKGRKHFFLDLALNPVEQLEQAACAIRNSEQLDVLPMTTELGCALKLRKAA